MLFVLLKRGNYVYGTCRQFSALENCLDQPVLIRAAYLRRAFTTRFLRTYVDSAAKQSPEVLSNADLSLGIYWEKFQPFFTMIQQRRNQAKKSIIVEVPDSSSICPLLRYCHNIGPSRCYFSYDIANKKYVLIEFVTEHVKERVLKSAGFSMYSDIIPVPSSYLWFKPGKEFKQHKERGVLDLTNDLTCKEADVIEELKQFKSMKNQMYFMYQKFKVSDISTRLRFLTCSQIETALRGVCPHVRALPFGSSVSGFGRSSADLDIYLQLSSPEEQPASNNQRLIFHSKTSQQNNTLILKLLGDMLSIMLPGCTNVRCISGARVPIIEYEHTITNMECDVQNSSGKGVDMTHMLWIMCSWDKRVAPLVYTLRYWAKVNQVTHSQPSRYMSNFNLTILIIYFLQSEGILPTLQFLMEKAEGTDLVRFIDHDQLNIIQDIRQLSKGSWKISNEATVDVLLLRFFEFYERFPFQSKAISIINSEACSKPTNFPMWVVNPLQPSLNITQNVRIEGCLSFQLKAREALRLLTKSASESLESPGLLPIISSDSSTNTDVQPRRQSIGFSKSSKRLSEKPTQGSVSEMMKVYSSKGRRW